MKSCSAASWIVSHMLIHVIIPLYYADSGRRWKRLSSISPATNRETMTSNGRKSDNRFGRTTTSTILPIINRIIRYAETCPAAPSHNALHSNALYRQHRRWISRRDIRMIYVHVPTNTWRDLLIAIYSPPNRIPWIISGFKRTTVSHICVRPEEVETKPQLHTISVSYMFTWINVILPIIRGHIWSFTNTNYGVKFRYNIYLNILIMSAHKNAVWFECWSTDAFLVSYQLGNRYFFI